MSPPFDSFESMKQRPPTLQSLQIIVITLAIGVTMFTAVVSWLLATGQTKPGPGFVPLFPAVWAALGFSEIIAWLAIRTVMRKQFAAAWQSSPKDDDARATLLTRFVSMTILRAALVEGWGLFAAVVLLLSGEWYMLAGPVITVGVLLGTFPTEGRLRDFVTDLTQNRM